MKPYVLIVLLLSFFGKANSQSYFMTGAREAAMANSILTIGGTWSVYHNPAGIANHNQTSVGLSLENRYLIKELNTQSFAGIIPTKNGGFGSSYSYFGTSNYNEQKFALAYAHTLGEKVDAGIVLDFYTSHLPGEYETDHAIAGEIGVIARPVKQLSIGVHLNNVSGSDFIHYEYEEPDMFFRSGITWNEQNFLVGTQVTISKQNKPILSAGTEISVVKNFDIRVGVSNKESSSFTFGIGYKQKRWQGNIAFARHPELGYSSFLSVEFNLGKLNR